MVIIDYKADYAFAIGWSPDDDISVKFSHDLGLHYCDKCFSKYSATVSQFFKTNFRIYNRVNRVCLPLKESSRPRAGLFT